MGQFLFTTDKTAYIEILILAVWADFLKNGAAARNQDKMKKSFLKFSHFNIQTVDKTELAITIRSSIT